MPRLRRIRRPWRRADADEVLQIIKAQGGMEMVNLAFYKEEETTAKPRWCFWRLDGPGFVWNCRVLPHLHTFVNISAKP